MSFTLTTLAWLALGVPTGGAFWRRGCRGMACAVVPFAGALALLIPVLCAAGSLGSLANWGLHAVLASLALGLAAHGLLGGAEPGPPPTRPAASRLEWIVAFAVLVLIGALNLHAGRTLAEGWPGYEWDGLAIWLVRAKVLAESAEFPVALFQEPQLEGSHWDYPLLLPSLLAWWIRSAGSEIRQLALPLGVVASLVPIATALGLARVLRPPVAAAVALVPLAMPELLLFHYRALADPLLVMVALAGLAWTLAGAALWDRPLLVAGGLALAAAVSLKNEGLLWWAASATGAVLASAHHRLPPRRWILGLSRALVPGGLLFVVWRILCRQLGAESTLLSGLRWDLVAERAGPLLYAMAEQVSARGNALILLACAVALFWATRGLPLAERMGAIAALLAAPVTLLVGFFFIYVATPHDLVWHVLTSLHRTLLGVVPAVCAATSLAPQLVRSLRSGRAPADGGARSQS